MAEKAAANLGIGQAASLPAGAGVLRHVASLWREEFRTDGDRALLAFDEAHSEVDHA